MSGLICWLAGNPSLLGDISRMSPLTINWHFQQPHHICVQAPVKALPSPAADLHNNVCRFNNNNSNNNNNNNNEILAIVPFHHSVHSASHQVFPGYQSCQFQYQLSSLGSTQLWCHHSTGNYSNTQAITVQPGTHSLLGLDSAQTGEVPCLRTQHHTAAAKIHTSDLLI